jgi:hypothetical protein
MGLFTRPFHLNGQPTVFFDSVWVWVWVLQRQAGTTGGPRLSVQERFHGRKWVRGLRGDAVLFPDREVAG